MDSYIIKEKIYNNHTPATLRRIVKTNYMNTNNVQMQNNVYSRKHTSMVYCHVHVYNLNKKKERKKIIIQSTLPKSNLLGLKK